MKKFKLSKKLNKLFVFILVTCMLVTSVTAEIQYRGGIKASSDAMSRVTNPKSSGGVTTWDCVYFGHYYQTHNESYTNDNDKYFNEPIKWRVLEKSGNDLFLLADQLIESIQYNQVDKKINPDTGEVDLTWENSDLREWLNDDFYNEAFDEEKGDIINTLVTADANSHSTDVQGNDVNDNVYVLSRKEAMTAKYGFVSSESENVTRSGVITDYDQRVHPNKSGARTINDGIPKDHAEAEKIDPKHPWDIGFTHKQNCGNYLDCGIWWLRTVASDAGKVYRVDYNGVVSTKMVADRNACVRPVIHVKADSEYLRYAGTVSSNGKQVDYCGNNATVSFNVSSNTLTIFGSGEMYDFGPYDAPWHKYYESIYTVVVDEEVTSVTENAFHDCQNISYMYLNDHVDAFSNKAIENMTLDFLVSVAKDSTAEDIVGKQLDYNYTNIRSKKPLAIEIKDVYNVRQVDDDVSFSFDNPMPGQSYEIKVDKILVRVIEDDIENPQQVIEVTLTDLELGRHVININPLVVGSKGLERRRAGKVIRINDQGYSNPVIEDKKAQLSRWDCVYFGTYPQSIETSEDATDTWTEDGKTYKKEPIMWRVLQNEGDTLLLMADQSLDNKRFDSKSSTAWKDCELRGWLNDDTGNENDPKAGFMTRAFNASEKAALVKSTTEEGTEDNVFLLSRSQMENEDYGFLADSIITKVRRSNATDYCGRKNNPSDKWPVYVNIATWSDAGKPPYDPSDTYHDRANIYWLINIHTTLTNRARVNYGGNTDEGKAGNGTNACVRPVIRVKLSSDAIQDAGSVNSYEQHTPPAKRYTIQIDGHVVDTVKEGSTYTLPEESNRKKSGASVSDGVKMGYIDLDDTDAVYKKGTTFTVDRDRKFKTLSSIDIQHGGAGIRVSKTKPRGIAFRSVVSVNEDDPMHTKAFQYGVLVTSYDDWYDVYDQNIEPDTEEVPGHRLYNVLFAQKDFVPSNPHYYTVAINNLKQANNTRQFVVKPYVLVHYQDGGGTEVVYASEPYTMCSAAQSAQNIMNDKTKWPSAYQKWQRDIVEYYLTSE